ncbi:MAG TPA: hypothetical protein ACFCUY_08400 [Xenococcaceae cyanobacterium]
MKNTSSLYHKTNIKQKNNYEFSVTLPKKAHQGRKFCGSSQGILLIPFLQHLDYRSR